MKYWDSDKKEITDADIGDKVFMGFIWDKGGYIPVYGKDTRNWRIVPIMDYIKMRETNAET